MVSLNAHLTRIERAQTSMLYSSVSTDGQVAQLVEHVTENHGVGGSIPSLATSNPNKIKRLQAQASGVLWPPF